MNLSKILAASALPVAASIAQAFQVVSLAPAGEIARISQVVVRFDDSTVNFGDPKAAAPLTLQCNDAKSTQGTGRRLNDRQ